MENTKKEVSEASVNKDVKQTNEESTNTSEETLSPPLPTPTSDKENGGTEHKHNKRMTSSRQDIVSSVSTRQEHAQSLPSSRQNIVSSVSTGHEHAQNLPSSRRDIVPTTSTGHENAQSLPSSRRDVVPTISTGHEHAQSLPSSNRDIVPTISTGHVHAQSLPSSKLDIVPSTSTGHEHAQTLPGSKLDIVPTISTGHEHAQTPPSSKLDIVPTISTGHEHVQSLHSSRRDVVPTIITGHEHAQTLPSSKLDIVPTISTGNEHAQSLPSSRRDIVPTISTGHVHAQSLPSSKLVIVPSVSTGHEHAQSLPSSKLDIVPTISTGHEHAQSLPSSRRDIVPTISTEHEHAQSLPSFRQDIVPTISTGQEHAQSLPSSRQDIVPTISTEHEHAQSLSSSRQDIVPTISTGHEHGQSENTSRRDIGTGHKYGTETNTFQKEVKCRRRDKKNLQSRLQKISNRVMKTCSASFEAAKSSSLRLTSSVKCSIQKNKHGKSKTKIHTLNKHPQDSSTSCMCDASISLSGAESRSQECTSPMENVHSTNKQDAVELKDRQATDTSLLKSRLVLEKGITLFKNLRKTQPVNIVTNEYEFINDTLLEKESSDTDIVSDFSQQGPEYISMNATARCISDEYVLMKLDYENLSGADQKVFANVHEENDNRSTGKNNADDIKAIFKNQENDSVPVEENENTASTLGKITADKEVVVTKYDKKAIDRSPLSARPRLKTPAELCSLLDPNVRESSKAFYEKSVEELSECLQSCGLGELAKVCEQEYLDGEFFRNIEKERLQEEPFNLSAFHINKLTKVINGWKPKHRDQSLI